MISFSVQNNLRNYLRANFYRLTATPIDILFLLFFGGYYFVGFFLGDPRISFGILGLLSFFFLIIPTFKYCIARYHKANFTEYYFDTDSFGTKLGPVTTKVDIAHLWKIYPKKCWLQLELKRGKSLMFAEDQKTIDRVISELKNSPYKKFIVQRK